MGENTPASPRTPDVSKILGEALLGGPAERAKLAGFAALSPSAKLFEAARRATGTDDASRKALADAMRRATGTDAASRERLAEAARRLTGFDEAQRERLEQARRLESARFAIEAQDARARRDDSIRDVARRKAQREAELHAATLAIPEHLTQLNAGIVTLIEEQIEADERQADTDRRTFRLSRANVVLGALGVFFAGATLALSVVLVLQQDGAAPAPRGDTAIVPAPKVEPPVRNGWLLDPRSR